MKERPILFSGPNVRAILGDHKTQTRRVINPQPFAVKGGSAWREDLHRITCRYGQSGDRLWVRETFVVDYEIGEGTRGEVPPAVFYRATDDGKTNFTPGMEMWKPSIHMPRNFCRLVLDVKAVRVERLQDISEEDARAEGNPMNCKGEIYESPSPEQDSRQGYGRYSFALTWESLNKKRGYGWSVNPWVWVIKFERVTTRDHGNESTLRDRQ